MEEARKENEQPHGGENYGACGTEVSVRGWFGFRSPKVLKHSCPEV